MERLLVTGVSELVGRKTVELARWNYEGIPLHSTKPLRQNSIEIDITNRKQVVSLFSRFKPDIAVHTAAETNVDRCETRKELAWKMWKAPET